MQMLQCLNSNVPNVANIQILTRQSAIDYDSKMLSFFFFMNFLNYSEISVNK